MRTGLTTAALTLIPTAAFAHPGLGDAHGFVAGFAHPLGGLDHILAMVTVGIFAWQLGGRALWLVPATFVLAMAAGGALGMAHVPVPLVQLGLPPSVIARGARSRASLMSGVRARCHNVRSSTSGFDAHRQHARDMEGLATGAVLDLMPA